MEKSYAFGILVVLIWDCIVGWDNSCFLALWNKTNKLSSVSPLGGYLWGGQKFYKTLVSLMETLASMEMSCSNMVELVCLIKDIIFDGLLKRPSPPLSIYKGRSLLKTRLHKWYQKVEFQLKVRKETIFLESVN